VIRSETKNEYYKKISDSKKRKTNKKGKDDSGIRTQKDKR
jgi:hypothetical protein